MANLSNEIVQFAAGNTGFYEKFQDYYFHKAATEKGEVLGSYDKDVVLSAKSTQVNDAYFAEIERVSGVPRSVANADSWTSNPMVQWVK